MEEVKKLSLKEQEESSLKEEDQLINQALRESKMQEEKELSQALAES